MTIIKAIGLLLILWAVIVIARECPHGIEEQADLDDWDKHIEDLMWILNSRGDK